MIDRASIQVRIDAIEAQRAGAVELTARCEGALQALRGLVAECLRMEAEQLEANGACEDVLAN